MASPFLIIFVAQSGSSAIMGDLRQNPNVKMRGEVFGAKALPNVEPNEQTDANRIAFLRKYWSNFRRGGSAITKGFKIQIDAQLPQFESWPSLPSILHEHSGRHHDKKIGAFDSSLEQSPESGEQAEEVRVLALGHSHVRALFHAAKKMRQEGCFPWPVRMSCGINATSPTCRLATRR